MHVNQRILFMAGFPRAGSTLLANILAQNPRLYPTPTSGLISSFSHMKDNWRMNDVYKSSGEQYIYPKIRSTLKFMLIGHYEEQMHKQQLPIDKNRGWTGNLDALDEIFGCRVQILYPIRHIGDVLISMEKVNRKSTLNNHGDNGNWLNERTTQGRAENLLKDDGILGMCLLNLREIAYRKQLDRLIFVPYNDMLSFPEDTFNRIYNQLGIQKFQHDFKNVVQVIQEQDMHHGFAPNSLHKIREGALERPAARDMTIFPADYLEKVEKVRFGDVTALIDNISAVKGILS